MYVVQRADFGINEVEVGVQHHAEVAALTNGNFATVFWQEGVDTSFVKVRLVDNSGATIGNEIVVSAGSNPQIAPVAGGGFMVAWSSSNGDVNGVKVQAYDSAALPVGGLTFVPGASQPALSVSGNGTVLVYETSVESDDVPDDLPVDNVPAIKASLISNTGAILSTTEVVRGVIAPGGGGSFNIFEVNDVAQFGDGHVMTWESYEEPEPGTLDIVSYVQAVAPGLVCPQVRVSFTVTGVADAGDGNFVVVGVAYNAANDSMDVVAQLFSATGQPVGGSFAVATSIEGEQHVPTVNAIPGEAGGFIVAWHDELVPALRVQAFDAGGQMVGEESTVSLDPSDGFPMFSDPDIAVDSEGDFLVVWTGWDASSYGVRGQLYRNPTWSQLFSDQNDDVDFGALTDDQKEAIAYAAANGRTGDIYYAGGGDDFVVLPDVAQAQLTPFVTWDFARLFEAAAGHDTVIGGDGNDKIDGGEGDDFLIGDAGNDVLTGGGGTDLASYDSAMSAVTISLALAGAQATGGAGTDTLSGIEGLDGSQFNDALTGDALGNYLYGNGGNDSLVGGGGDDWLDGGAGDDTIDGGTGDDLASYSSANAGVTVSLAKTGAQATGGAGSDTLIGIEDLYGSAFGDSLTGNASTNYLYGRGGNDTIDGGAGADSLYGGSGDDIFVIDNVGDAVVESSGQGTDEVRAGLTYTLTNNVENLRLTGAVAINGTGNGLDNVIRGNDAANSLFGLVGSDKLYGNGGDDTIDGGQGDDYLYGLLGNDTLNGGAGYDRMYGGVGDDTYIVNDVDDYAYEVADEGRDRVLASIDHQLRSDVEDLTLTGVASIGKGNLSDNLIVGNDVANKLYGYEGHDTLDGAAGDDFLLGAEGNDTLTGGAGYDRMYGGTGNDTFVVNDLADYAYENVGEGYDTALASINHQLRPNIEQLVMAGFSDLRGYGNALDNMMIGNSGSNLLYGKDGNDTIRGNLGNDILYGENGGDFLYGGSGLDRFYGGAGADLFAFENLDFGGMSSGTADRIHDFSHAQGDRISLELVDANSALGFDQAFTFVGTAAFSGVAGQLRYQQISGNTYVQGDTNGDGAADFWIRIDGLHALVSSDLVL